MNAVEINQLRFGYDRKHPLFEGIDLTFAPGHVYGLLGPNGAGKTSLLKLMVGALFPDAGNIQLWGEEVTWRKAEPLARTYFLQEEFALPPWKPGLIAWAHGKFYPNFSEEAFWHVLERLGGVPDKPVSKFSRGMKQKVAIATALAAQTDLLLLDEPFRGLDVPSRREFRRLLIEHASPERAIIISTHELREVHNLIDYVVFLWQGKVLLSASIEGLAALVSTVEVPDKPENAFYYEESAGQWRAVVPGPAKQALDLEFLFVALTRSESLRTFFTNAKIQ